jgi:hypothetical protein
MAPARTSQDWVPRARETYLTLLLSNTGMRPRLKRTAALSDQKQTHT